MATKKPAAKKPAAKKPAAKKPVAKPGGVASRAARGPAVAAKSTAAAARSRAPVKRPAVARPAATPARFVLAVGTAAPAFELPDHDGRTVRLGDFAGKKLVVYFYPKDDTPGCTREACEFQASLPALAGRGVAVVGISRDGAASHTRFRGKYGLGFPLLSDPDGATHAAYCAWGTKSMYGRTITGALRTTVLIDERGRVARVWPSVKVDGHVAAVLAALDATA